MRGGWTQPDRRLVGRGAEQDLLGRVLADGAAGRPAAWVVHGEAGVGKTRLIREVCADPDLLVLWGSCVHFGGASVPYAPIIGILQDWLASADAAEQAEVLANADELGTLLPGIGGSRGALTGRLVPVVDLVLNRIADRHRTVVVVDDLHWADVASLDVLAYLITGFRGQHLTVLGTCRDEDRGAGHPLHGWLADMRRMPSFEEIHLERLEPTDTGVQLEDLLGRAPDIDLVTQVQARSDGNPYLTELLVEDLSGAEAVLPATVPEGLRDALLAAWHRLSEQARQLVQVLAVGGRPTTLDVLSAVASRHDFDTDRLAGSKHYLDRRRRWRLTSLSTVSKPAGLTTPTSGRYSPPNTRPICVPRPNRPSSWSGCATCGSRSHRTSAAPLPTVRRCTSGRARSARGSDGSTGPSTCSAKRSS